MGLEALFAFCGLPLECSEVPAWEGQTVQIEGWVDPVNIFDRRTFPQLPYEKFVITDQAGRSIEVWPDGETSPAVFDKLAQRSSDRMIVRGRLSAVRLPINKKCTQGVKVLIDDEKQIQFKEK
jgi:hypothetical protein